MKLEILLYPYCFTSKPGKRLRRVDDAQVVDMAAVGADQGGDAFLNLLARYGVLALFHEVIVTRLQHLDIIHTLQKRRKLRIAVISNIKLRKFLL